MEKSKSWKVETPWIKSKGNEKDKSGAVHTPMSRARDLARKAMKEKSVKEEVVQVNELSKSTLSKYKSKAIAQAKNSQYYARYGDPDDYSEREAHGKNYDKRKAGVAAANKRLGEAMDKADQPAYLRKQKGEKLTLADVKAPRKDSISSKEALAKARGVKEDMDLIESLDKHFEKWTNSEYAPFHKDSGDFNKIHKSALKYLKRTDVPADKHDEMADKLTNKYHGIEAPRYSVKEEVELEEKHDELSQAQRSAEIARLKAEKAKHDADAEEHKQRKSTAYSRAKNEADANRDATFKQSPSWEYGVRANKEHEKNRDVRRHIEKQQGEANVKSKQEFSKIINKALNAKLHKESIEEALYTDTATVDKPGHPLHGKQVDVVGVQKHLHHDGGGSATVIHHNGKNSSIGIRHLIMKEENTLDEARGRPRKNPAPVKAKDDDEEEHLPDRGPEPDQNIHQQLKRAADTEHHEVKGKEGFKTKGGAHVTFANGEKHFVHADHAKKVLSALERLKPADRSKMAEHIHQSHSHFQAVHKLVS